MNLLIDLNYVDTLNIINGKKLQNSVNLNIIDT